MRGDSAFYGINGGGHGNNQFGGANRKSYRIFSFFQKL